MVLSNFGTLLSTPMLLFQVSPVQINILEILRYQYWLFVGDHVLHTGGMSLVRHWRVIALYPITVTPYRPTDNGRWSPPQARHKSTQILSLKMLLTFIRKSTTKSINPEFTSILSRYTNRDPQIIICTYCTSKTVYRYGDVNKTTQNTGLGGGRWAV